MKKKLIILSFILVFILGTLIGSTEAYNKTITAWFYDIKLFMDGKQWTFVNKPFIYNGNTYVSVNDLARNMNLNLQWDSQTNTFSLTSVGNDDLTLSALKYKLDKQNLEINNLRFQLAQKEAELAILKDNINNSYYDEDEEDILEELEDFFEEEYDRYDDNEDLYFDNYRLTQGTDDDIIVKMYGEFKRSSNDWEDRDKSDFRDFIEDICKEIDREFNEDIKITVYDKNNNKTAEYKWDDSSNKLYVEYEY